VKAAWDIGCMSWLAADFNDTWLAAEWVIRRTTWWHSRRRRLCQRSNGRRQSAVGDARY
jgi:hypothetical protein